MDIQPTKYNLKLSEKEIKELDNILQYAIANMQTSDKEIPKRKQRLCKQLLNVINKRTKWLV